MASDPVKAADQIRFGEDFELDLRAYELRRAGRVLKLERIPMEMLLLLIEERGQLVTRDRIIEKIWGKDVFLDTDNSVNAAIRKIRQVLKDDPEQPRFVQTITGRGYRFIAAVTEVSPTAEKLAETPSSGSKTTSLGPGCVVSHYRIREKIASGGMGVVYEAEDVRLGRRVALKCLPENLARDSKALERLLREARTASSLNHPNICTIYEIDEHAGGPIIVMELLQGQNLKELLRNGAMKVGQLSDIGMQVAGALEAAHAHGIIHRDIKPANIFVVDPGRVKILDFGLVKLMPSHVPEQEAERESLTVEGVIPGTTAYMSPEQVRDEEIDGRSDLFSLGVVLYKMATGQHPFVAKNRMRTMDAILNAKPALPSKVNPALPASLDAIISKALKKDRNLRYQSAAEMRADLQHLNATLSSAPAIGLTTSPVKATEVSGPLRQKFWKMLVPAFDRFSEKPVKQVETRKTNLPVQRTGFVGREKEVAAAKELLLRQDVRLVTVTGPGGIGKTRLAVQVAGSLVERFPGGTHFVPLSSLSDPGLIASVIVQTLGIREAGGQSPLEILKKNLQDSLRAPMLLLLDNFEHVIQAAPTVAELLAMDPNLKIMVTSRAALHVYGEHEFPVPPLALPDSRSMPPVEILSRYPAVALFVQRAVAVKPDFELNRENGPAVTEICARLDGLPLAIELAAARVKVLSPSSMRTRLASRLRLLTGGARDLPQRQQTLRAAMDWSYDLLSAAEQKLFRRLSVFAGGCNLEGVEAVCDTKRDLDLDLLDGMASMVDKSLVQPVEHAKGESRFVMLETIREYALEKLEASGEEAPTKRAHAAYCLVLAEEEPTEQSGAEGAEWLERFALEHDNFRAGLEWLTETGDAEWGLRLGAALFRFWEMREYLAEGRDRLGKLLKLAGAAAPTRARARVLFAAGVLAGEQGDYASADALIAESLDIARQQQDKQGIAVSLNALAVHARDRGDIAVACSLFEESLLLWRELGEPKAVARSLSNLANVVKLQSDYARARSLYAECLAIFQGIGDRTCVAWSLNYQGDVARDQSDPTAARTLYEQALSIFRELSDEWGIAGTLADLGNLARQQQDYSSAHSLYRESIKLFEELGHKRGIARLLECFACSAAAQLGAERSLRLAGAAAALRQNIGAPLTPAEQAKLEAALHPAREALTNTAGEAAWLEGWALPVEKAIKEVLTPVAASRSR
jgi:predicted ATPase/serine/threonine protein kinase